MTKQEVINYIIETPGNTNPAVLSGILNEFGAGDNKEEIELTATENTVYTPDEGKVYKKVTVNVPAPVSAWTTAIVTVEELSDTGGLDNNYVTLPIIEDNSVKVVAIYGDGVYTVPLYNGTAHGSSYKGVETVSGDCTVSGNNFIITGDCAIGFNA